jgi:hypothetical protein
MKYVILYRRDEAECACKVKSHYDFQAFNGMVWWRAKEINKAEFETLTEAFGVLQIRSIRDYYRKGIRHILHDTIKSEFNPYLPLGQG